MDLISSIYHERQEPGSMLCAQNCLNNLLQNPMFTPQDLSDIARSLDELEASHLDPTAHNNPSENYDDTGFFSIMVMEEALKVLGLRLARWQSEEMKDRHDYPERMEGFVLNHDLHWYTIRRFSTTQRFYNLDSCISTPEWISPLLLSMQLHAAEQSGYSVFVVVPTEESQIKGLPACAASDQALNLPAPRSNNREKGLTSSSFSGNGNTLGSNSSSGASSSKASTSATLLTHKRRPSTPTLQDRLSPNSNSAETSSVEEESERRRIRPRFDKSTKASTSNSKSKSKSSSDVKQVKKKRHQLTEEEEMELAIAQSLGQAVEVENSDGEEEVLVLSDDEEVEIMEEPSTSNRSGNNQKGKESTADKISDPGIQVRGSASSSTSNQSSNIVKGRAEQDEDTELARAIQESMKMENSSSKGKQVEVVEESDEEDEVDDEPTVEELRRRRLARFA